MIAKRKNKQQGRDNAKLKRIEENVSRVAKNKQAGGWQELPC